MRTRTYVAALLVLVAALATACSGSDESATPDTGPSDSSGSELAGLGSFCDAFIRLDVEQPESYIGSPEQVADIDGLLSLAPDPVRDDVSTFRDYLASGAIDSEVDPDSNLIENWPAEVQAATGELQTFGAENC